MTLWSCRETSRLIARGETSVSSWAHLLYCRYCRRYRRQLRMLARAARLLEPARREAFERELIGRLTA